MPYGSDYSTYTSGKIDLVYCLLNYYFLSLQWHRYVFIRSENTPQLYEGQGSLGM
jgi:hypothetical protein